MQVTARKVLKAIDGVHIRGVRDAVSEDRSAAGSSKRPSRRRSSGAKRWQAFLKNVKGLSRGLCKLKPLRNLSCEIERCEQRYQRGAAADGPIHDPFFSSGMLAHATVNASGETQATIIAEVLRALEAPERLVAKAEIFSASYCGIYVVADRHRDIVRLEELVTGDRFVVRISKRYPCQPGMVWWVRLLPNFDGTWSTLGSPYVFTAPNARDEWLAFFERAAGPLTADSYRHFMRRGAKPEYWFEFINQAYAGHDTVVYLKGVPDRAASWPCAAVSKHRAGEPRNGARSALLAWAEQSGCRDGAGAAFRFARRLLGVGDRQPQQWSEAERTMAEAYAAYGHLDEQGRTALEVALDTDRGRIGPMHRAQLESVRAGWFSVFVITSIHNGTVLKLRDILRGRRLVVVEKCARPGMAVGDVLAGWVSVEADGIARLEGAFTHVSMPMASKFLSAMRHIDGLFRQSLPELPEPKRLGLLAPFAVCAFARLNQAPQALMPVRRPAPARVVWRRRRPRQSGLHQLPLFDVASFDAAQAQMVGQF